MVKQDIVIGVDGGQTTTLALCARLDGTILSSALAGPSNHYDELGGPERLVSAITDSVSEALRQAQVDAERAAALWLGMTGSEEAARRVGQSLLPKARVDASLDMVTALAGASAGGSGVVVISGTGCIAYGHLDDGRSARASGWGYIMGDEGSGYDIGIQALRAATQAWDGRAAPTELTWRVPAAFDLPDLWAVHRAVYAHTLSRGDIARLARIVSEAAAAGDATSQRLLAAAGEQLADAALAVIAALDCLERGLSIYTTGGVFAAGEPLAGAFRARIAQTSPASQVLPARFSPVIGSVLLALKLAGVSPSADILARLADSLPPQAQMKSRG